MTTETAFETEANIVKIPDFNPFDFTNTDDLPAELAKRLTRSIDDKVKEWADVVTLAGHFGAGSLDIAQVIAAATRLGMDVPAETTVRSYLNRALELDLIEKPTRQTYGPKTKAKRAKAASVETADPVATEEPAPAVPAVEDVLAGL